ncbi:hypothetical protein dsat_2223 [Alkalidesulfovibrio alkalitolerans DSM 16529]|uniref:Uncharacterized protein n=1 Tax=Alkalidesulfovibrio alkalitolerans DSM 16529 TaxID=1121439 RepID=S7TE57_9BACT|nr:hypothetical protein [Alkalidesulfovibrio alkalitolerans]EPR34860.1 hypothetical protein dsat_2223 [Alkalidesulfovibrio alkalitolerans DSM 16529]
MGHKVGGIHVIMEHGHDVREFGIEREQNTLLMKTGKHNEGGLRFFPIAHLTPEAQQRLESIHGQFVTLLQEAAGLIYATPLHEHEIRQET